MELSSREGTGGRALRRKKSLYKGQSRAQGNRRVLAVLCVCEGVAEAGVARGEAPCPGKADHEGPCAPVRIVPLI